MLVDAMVMVLVSAGVNVIYRVCKHINRKRKEANNIKNEAQRYISLYTMRAETFRMYGLEEQAKEEEETAERFVKYFEQKLLIL